MYYIRGVDHQSKVLSGNVRDHDDPKIQMEHDSQLTLPQFVDAIDARGDTMLSTHGCQFSTN